MNRRLPVANAFLRPQLVCALLATSIWGCGSSPEVNNASVQPSTFQVSGLVNTVTFNVSCHVLNFSSSVSSVVATVEGQSTTFSLAQSGGVPGDEQWSGTQSETLWNGFSAGVYQIDLTAEDASGTSVTDRAAATVTITN